MKPITIVASLKAVKFSRYCTLLETGLTEVVEEMGDDRVVVLITGSLGSLGGEEVAKATELFNS